MPTTNVTAFTTFLDHIRAPAAASGLFGDITVRHGRLECAAAASAQPAFYRIELDGERVWVSLVMADRWLSESIEADLMHSGDSLEELLEEELIDQGHEGGPLSFEHFRSDDMLFTFRSPLPVFAHDLSDPAAARSAAQTATRCLLAYEACFRELGDMSGGEED